MSSSGTSAKDTITNMERSGPEAKRKLNPLEHSSPNSGTSMKKISIIPLCLVAAISASTTFAQRTAEDYYKTSKSRLSKRDLDGALAALDKAIELKPEFALAFFERNRIYMLKGKIDLAQADLDKALLLDPDMRDAYADRAQIRM